MHLSVVQHKVSKSFDEDFNDDNDHNLSYLFLSTFFSINILTGFFHSTRLVFQGRQNPGRGYWGT